MKVLPSTFVSGQVSRIVKRTVLDGGMLSHWQTSGSPEAGLRPDKLEGLLLDDNGCVAHVTISGTGFRDMSLLPCQLSS